MAKGTISLPDEFPKKIDRVDSSVLIGASPPALRVEMDCPYIPADRRLFERTRSDPRVRHLSRVGKLP